MAFKAPNITGPRFRKEYKTVLTRELYARFLKLYPTQNITFNQFRSIIKLQSEKMWKIVIDKREGIELPIGSTIFIGSTVITKRSNYNMQASIAANTPVTHRNYDTDGHVAKIFYSQRTPNNGRSSPNIWSFKGTRDFKRALSKEYSKDWKKYRDAEDTAWKSQRVARQQRKEYMEAKTNEAIKTYNEFDLN